MCWKKLPYWLKGGIIGLIVGIVVVLINLIKNKFQFCYTLISEIGGFGIITICDYIWRDYVLPFLIIVLIGIVIGFIVGKIKQSKKRR